MTSSALLPPVNDKNSFFQPSNRYSIHDFGQGYRTYSYELDLFDYEPEQITVLLDNQGRLRIRAYRPICREFRREYDLGGSDVETRLVRNTIDTHGRLRVDVDVRPRQYETSSINNNILTFDLQGYRPKNVNVRINEHGLLKVNAQHTDETVGHRVTREYYRQYQLPKHITPDQIRAKINDNQILTIELPQALPNEKQSWEPYYDKNDLSGYGNRSSKNSCCCIM